MTATTRGMMKIATGGVAVMTMTVMATALDVMVALMGVLGEVGVAGAMTGAVGVAAAATVRMDTPGGSTDTGTDRHRQQGGDHPGRGRGHRRGNC